MMNRKEELEEENRYGRPQAAASASAFGILPGTQSITGRDIHFVGKMGPVVSSLSVNYCFRML